MFETKALSKKKFVDKMLGDVEYLKVQGKKYSDLPVKKLIVCAAGRSNFQECAQWMEEITTQCYDTSNDYTSFANKARQWVDL